LQFFSASYEKPPGPVRYPGLKIFTPLTLRFQDFQRRRDMKEMQLRMTIKLKLGALITVAIGIVAALVKLLYHG
jgi:hypothetical protein